MLRCQLNWSNVIAGMLVFGSLGFSALIGTANAIADDQSIIAPAIQSKVVAPTNGTPEAGASLDGPASASQFRGTVRVAKAGRAAKSQLLGVYLSKDGLLTGRLNLTDSISGAHVPAEELTVSFVQRGSVLAKVKPGPGGVFQVDKLSPGVMTMVAWGADGFFSTALVIHPARENEQEAKSSTPSLQIDATVVHPANVPIVSKLIRGTSDQKVSKGKRPQVANPVSRVEAVEEDLDATPVPVQTPVFTIGKDGMIRVNPYNIDPATGQRYSVSGVTVYLIQRGVVRTRSVVDQEGAFSAKGMIPGQYSFLALADNGGKRTFAAMGVIVEDSAGNSSTVGKSSRLSVTPARARMQQDNNGPPAINMGPTSDLDQTPLNEQGPPPPDQPAVGGGGFTGGGGGGGGGGGFGGALGALGLGAGIAGLAAALANQNNNAASPK